MLDHFIWAITDSGTVTIVTGAFGVVIERKTGRIVKVVPEHPILRTQTEAVAAGVDLLRNTEGLKGVEELRLQAAKFVASMAQTVTAEVAAKAA